MTQLSPSPVLLEDSQLLQVAATPRIHLFPSLNRASAFAPLIIVCCVLPAFQLLAEPVFRDGASLWGLRGLAVANSKTLNEAMKAGVNESGQPLIFQPPLAAWMNGMVIRVLGPSQPLAQSIISLFAAGVAIWITTRLAWRMGGANTSLVAGLLMCSHPLLLEIATTPSNSCLGFCLMLTSVFGFQRHLEGMSTRVSLGLLISGLTWGLSVLAIGPVAFSLPLMFAIHSLDQRAGPNPVVVHRSLWDINGWSVLRSTFVFLFIGILVCGWWCVVMFWEFGLAFWNSWWTSLPVECLTNGTSEWQCNLSHCLRPSWHDWIVQQAFILGWLIVGLERAWNEWRHPTSEYARRRYQLLLLWFVIAFTGRVLADAAGRFFITNTRVWDLALLGPTVLLASFGIGTLIERALTRRGESCLVVLLVCLIVSRITMSLTTGLATGAMVMTFLICGPWRIALTSGVESEWAERFWRYLLRFTVYAFLLACISFGLGMRNSVSEDDQRLADLRFRLLSFPEVQRISLMETRDPIPVSLRSILRYRWPKAEMVTVEGWDAGLTQAMAREAADPQSRFLILEWTRREISLPIDTGQAWQMSSVGDPIRFHGQRLSLVLIEPRT